jgi:hypothetical protein
VNSLWGALPLATLVPLVFLGSCEGTSPSRCSGSDALSRCVDGSPQTCEISAQQGAGGTGTATWVQQKCPPQSACIDLADSGARVFCAYTSDPIPECADAGNDPVCWNAFATRCMAGYPEGALVSPCSAACVRGFCALSSAPDPSCPQEGPYATGAYCSAQGPVTCYQGFDVDFDAGSFVVPIADRPENPCANPSDAQSPPSSGDAPSD